MLHFFAIELDGNHLPLHLSGLGGRLLVTADEESRRLENDNRGCGRDAVFRSLPVLGP
jgi:hypothetical protein